MSTSFNFIEVTLNLETKEPENKTTITLLYSFNTETDCGELFSHMKHDFYDFYPEDDSDDDGERIFEIKQTDTINCMEYIINSMENLKAIIDKYFYTKSLTPEGKPYIYLNVISLRK